MKTIQYISQNINNDFEKERKSNTIMHNTLQQKLVIKICQNIMNLQLNLIQYILFKNILLLLPFVVYKSYLQWSSVPKTSLKFKVALTEINNTFEFQIYHIFITE